MKTLNTSKRKILTLTLIITLSTLFLTSVAAQEEQQDTDITVEIEEETIIDIQPSSIAWTENEGIVPGNVAGPEDEVNDYGALLIENLGSVDIDEVWFDVSQPTESPFGTGDASAYDPGNFITIGEETRFVDRVEYGIDTEEDGEIIFLTVPETNDEEWTYGRLRNTSQEYFWAIDTTVAEEDESTINIGVNPRTEEETGSTDLTDCEGGDGIGDQNNDQCNSYGLSLEGSTAIEVGDLDIDGSEGEEYCAVVDFNDGEAPEPSVNFIKWNPQATGAQSGGCEDVTEFIVDGENPLVPGEFTNIPIRAFVPFGVVADGDLPAGDLTVFANSAQ